MRFLYTFLVVLVLLSSSVFPLYASEDEHNHDLFIGGETEEEKQKVENLDNQIKELETKISDAQSRERTLSSQIGYMDNQIKLTTLRVTETEKKIEELTQEVEELGDKIDHLEQSLTNLTSILIERVVSTYKLRKKSFAAYIFGADSVGEILERGKYIATAQANDKKVLFDVQETKVTYGEQKSLRERKKEEQEILKTELEAQKKQLDVQRAEKQNLLQQTKNDETEYQRLLQQALSEKNALEAALISGVEVGPVEKGDPIALVGNTGYPYCSSGAHLHFEVRKNNQWVNAGDYLQNKTVKDDQNGGETSIGGGGWQWPLEGTIRVTQYYGKTPYSWRYAYSGGIHTGIDMVSDTTSVIRAPEKGTLYSSSQACGTATIKIKYIDHGDGVLSFYLHVQ